MTIDQKNDRIRLTRQSNHPIETPAVRDIGFVTGRNSWIISDVFPGSAAAAAGVRVGDEIVSMNGIKPTEPFGASRIRNAMMQEKVTLELRRGGDVLTFELPVVDQLP